jgi:hypothetical protein
MAVSLQPAIFSVSALRQTPKTGAPGSWKTAVGQGKVDSYTIGFLTPMSDRTDIEFRLSFDDSENFGNTTALTVYLYYFGGS